MQMVKRALALITCVVALPQVFPSIGGVGAGQQGLGASISPSGITAGLGQQGPGASIGPNGISAGLGTPNGLGLGLPGAGGASPFPGLAGLVGSAPMTGGFGSGFQGNFPQPGGAQFPGTSSKKRRTFYGI